MNSCLERCEKLVQDSMESLIIQPSSLENVRIKKDSSEELVGFGAITCMYMYLLHSVHFGRGRGIGWGREFKGMTFDLGL